MGVGSEAESDVNPPSGGLQARSVLRGSPIWPPQVRSGFEEDRRNQGCLLLERFQGGFLERCPEPNPAV